MADSFELESAISAISAFSGLCFSTTKNQDEDEDSVLTYVT